MTNEKHLNIVGENSVGIGTDWVQDQDVAFFEYLQKDKETGRFVTTPYKVVPPYAEGNIKVKSISKFPTSNGSR